MAAGRSGAEIDSTARACGSAGCRCSPGQPLEYDERAASDALRGEDVLLRLDLARGSYSATAWGCDMTPEYVHINSDYTT